MSGNTVSFRWINNNGGGFAENAEVLRNTTVGDFLNQKLGSGVNFEDYTIRYTPNGGQPDIVSASQVIEEGSRLTCAARKVVGE